MSRVPRKPSWRAKYHILFLLGTAFIVEGSCMRKKLIELGCPEHKVKIVHLGVELDKFEFVPRRIKKGENIKFLMCSRFVEKKGIPYAIKAFAKALERHDNIELNIAGGESKEFQMLINELDVGDKIRILGRKPHAEVPGIMRESHVFLAPSVTAIDGDTEGGTPTTILESSATGMAVVSSFHADIPEAVVDGKTGLLSPERDVDKLAQNIIRIAADPTIIASMGAEGRKHIENEYDSEKETAKLEKIYSKIIGHDY
jgi:colanic acid/amylovoran biosynthesis glycosyltransferase